MVFVTPRVLLCTAALTVTLSACEEGQLFAPATGDDESAEDIAVVPASRVEIQEVERSDIFSTRELALWDGRPSLGGIWVAHPDVGDPERVRIQNTTNGQTVTGALFRRERANPGPRIQVSSEAAAALDVLAGQPTELDIVVLRQEEVVIEPTPIPVDEPAEDTEDDTTEEISSGEATAAVASATTVTATATAAAEAPPKRPGFWQRFRESLRDKPEPSDSTDTATNLAPAADASVPDVETEPLDPLAAASAAIDDAEQDAAAAAQPATESVATTPVPPGLKNPFVQVGLFSVEANATAAAANLRQAGIVPTIAGGANGDRRFWRVLVGPMTGAGEQAEILAQVRGLGYADAFLTPN